MKIVGSGRGVHPKIRSTAIRFWGLDDNKISQAIETHLFGSALNLDEISGIAAPVLRPSPIGGRGRRGSIADSRMLATADASADSAAMIDELTFSIWCRSTATHASGFGFYYKHGGDRASELEVDNVTFSVGVGVGNDVFVFWEQGAGVNVLHSFAFKMRNWRWTYLTFRRRDIGAGQSEVDLFVNGVFQETSAALTNATGGTSTGAKHSILGVIDGAGSNDHADAEIASVLIDSALLSSDDIEKDFRRGFLLDFHPTTDLRVEVVDGNGERRDLTDLEGIDWVDSVTINESANDAVATAEITLLREQANMSVAVLKTDTKLNLTDVDAPLSYGPLLNLAREYEIFSAVVPLGINASGHDWIQMQKGDLVKVGWGGEKVSLRCGSQGARLTRARVEEEIVNSTILPGEPVEKQPSYGLTTGEALEIVLQKILDDNDNDTGNNSVTGLVARTGSYAPITLRVPVATTWALLPYRQRQETVMQALRAATNQIGGDCKYVFDPETEQNELTLFVPERDRLDNDIIIGPDDYLNVSNADLDLTTMRTVVKVTYPSSETTLPPIPALPAGFSGRSEWFNLNGVGERLPAMIEITNDAAIAAYGDNSRQHMGVGEDNASQIDTIAEATPYCLGMLQDVSQPEFTHNVSTPLMPMLEVNDMMYLRTSKRLYTAAQLLAAFALTHTFAASSTTAIKMRGKPSAGFKRWLMLDDQARGAKSAVTDPRKALFGVERGPLLRLLRHLNDQTDFNRGGKFLQVPNGVFAQWSAGINLPPDGWRVTAGAWGATDDIEHSATVTRSGGHSLKFKNTTGELESELFPIDGDEDTPYSIQVQWQRDAISTKGPQLTVEWIGIDRVTVLTTQVLVLGAGFPAEATTANVWLDSRVDGIVPPAGGAAKFMRLIAKQDTVGGVAINLYVDFVAAYFTGRGIRVYNGVTDAWQVPLAGTPWQLLVYSNPPLFGSFDYGNNFTAANGPGNGTYFEAKQPGTYRYSVQVALANSAAGSYGNIRIYKNATYDTRNKNNLATGTVIALGQAMPLALAADAGLAGIPQTYANICTMSSTVVLEKGDRVSVEFWTNNAAGVAALGQATTGDLTTLFDIKLELAQ